MKLQAYKIQNYIKNIANEKIAGCLLYGPEISVASYRFDFIAKKIVTNLADPFLVSNISKERLKEDAGILADEFFSFSMLGGRKLIIVKGADESCAKALEILCEDNNFAAKSDNFILIQAGDLKPTSKLRKLAESSNDFISIACYEDDEKTIKTFIETILRNHKISFNADVIAMLVDKFGKNRQIILTEIEKIITFLGDKKELNIEVADKLIKVEGEISADEFVLNYASRNREKALKNCQKLFRDNFEPITLIRFLSNYFQKIYDAKVAIKNDIDLEDAIKAQRLFFKTEISFRKHLNDLSLEFINGSLEKFSLLELNIKQGNLPPKLAFESFVNDSLFSK